MYQVKLEHFNTNKKQIAIEIYRSVEDPEVPDLIETKIFFISIDLPEDWEILRTWKPEKIGDDELW